MKHKEEKCFNCNKGLKDKDVYILYSLIITTDIKTHFIGLVKLLDELDDYLMSKFIHLSGSQVVLLRPDILKEFFIEKFKPERPMSWYLCSHLVCDGCFQKYTELVPVR